MIVLYLYYDYIIPYQARGLSLVHDKSCDFGVCYTNMNVWRLIPSWGSWRFTSTLSPKSYIKVGLLALYEVLY